MPSKSKSTGNAINKVSSSSTNFSKISKSKIEVSNLNTIDADDMEFTNVLETFGENNSSARNSG